MTTDPDLNGGCVCRDAATVGQLRRVVRHLRWMLGVTLIGLGGIAVALHLEGQERCRAENRLRREAIPAAFAEHDKHLGEELGASEERIAEFDREFQAALDDLFPEQPCGPP